MSRFRFIDRYAVDPDRLGLIISFVAVAERLSFVDAAKELNLMSSTISRQVSKLESSLGVRLFSRTTRRVAMTEAGEHYYRECRLLLQSLVEMDSMIKSLNSEPRGYLKISVPVALGRLHVNSMIAAFLNLHENLKVEANYTDRFVDIVGEGYDLVVRTGVLPDSGLVAKKVATNRRLLVASPRYIAKHGVPKSPADLINHNCLRFSYYSASGSNWHLANGTRDETVAVTGNFISDSSEAICQAAVEGLGIGLIASYLASDKVLNGTLVPLLPQWKSQPEAGIYIVYPSARYVPTKVKAFVAFIEKHFRFAEWNLENPIRKPRRRKGATHPDAG